MKISIFLLLFLFIFFVLISAYLLNIHFWAGGMTMMVAILYAKYVLDD